MSVTIVDVAKEVNLSISTISKYINGRNVRPENAKRIEEAITKLGFVPNQAARELRNLATPVIGLILDSLCCPYFAKINLEYEKQMNDLGYSYVVCCHHNEMDKLFSIIGFLKDYQVDGILLVPIYGMEEHSSFQNEVNLPVVAIDRSPKHGKLDSVTTNSTKGAYEATEYLIEQGHKQIAIITGADIETPSRDTALERYEGFHRAMDDYGIPVSPDFVIEGNYTFEAGFNGLYKLWEQKKKPTALFTSNYHTSMGVVAATLNLGIAIPDELSLIVFDDVLFSTISEPNLTAIRQPAEEIARESLALLLKRIAGDRCGFPKKIRLNPTLNIRDSVKNIEV